jgi:hypothetical protein
MISSNTVLNQTPSNLNPISHIDIKNNLWFQQASEIIIKDSGGFLSAKCIMSKKNRKNWGFRRFN